MNKEQEPEIFNEPFNEPVPYIVYERTIARFERIVKRLIIAILIAVAILFVTNLAWLWVFNSYEVVTQDVLVDSDDGGNASYIGANGSIVNGKGDSKDESQAKEE